MARACATKQANRLTNFKYSAPDANAVYIAGTFNNWDVTSNPLKKEWTGMWKTSLKLVPGKYEYKYIVDGSWQNDPSCQSCVPNDFGSANCIKVVR